MAVAVDGFADDGFQPFAAVFDVAKGRGGMFSLEGPEGLRFLTRSRLFTDEEWAAIEAGGR